ncbi:MAG TPA: hypothetical protein VID69_00140 [Actinomycetota bacterium]|jgi:hypothetical protein
MATSTQDLHHAEPSTDFPTLDESFPRTEPRSSRLPIVAVATAGALVGAVIGYLVGRGL